MPFPQRILQVFNEYRIYGGEDTVVGLEARLLREAGHDVECLTVSTKEIIGANFLRLALAGFGTVWSFRGYRALKKALRRFAPDIVHVHNTFPLFSPSIYWAADRAAVPLVQTLHNYRLTCANGQLFRDDRTCQKCVGHFPWAALRYRCYLHSFWKTAPVATANVAHRWLGTFRNKVPAYIALTEFSQGVMVRSGLPKDKIFIKPNFTITAVPPESERRPQVVFLGGDQRRKGLHFLLAAWKRLAPSRMRLVLIGSGTDDPEVQRRYGIDSSVQCLGFQPREKVIEHLAASRLFVLPSLDYESFPLAMLEAFSVGTPVIVPNHGAFPSLVTHRKEGMLFTPGDVSSLAETLQAAISASDEEWRCWSQNARNKHLREYTARSNYEQLISIYRQTIASFQASRAGRKPSQNVVPVELLGKMDSAPTDTKLRSVRD